MADEPAITTETGEGPPIEEGEGNVSPEEQDQYNMFMEKVGDILYGAGEGAGKIMPEILQSLSGAKGGGQPTDDEGAETSPDDEGAEGEGGDKGNPAVMALANTAVQVVQKIDTAGFEAGNPVSDEVVYHAAVETIELLAEISEKAGIHDFSEEELTGALYQAVDLYRPIAEELGRTNEDTLKQQFGEISEADKQGKLGELLPGFDGATMDGGASPPPVQAQ